MTSSSGSDMPPFSVPAAAVDEAEHDRSKPTSRTSVSVASEVALTLPGKSHYEVGGNADVRPHAPQLADLFLEFNRGVAALHEREHAVGAALHRQMQMAGKLRHVGEGLDQAVGELERVGR